GGAPLGVRALSRKNTDRDDRREGQPAERRQESQRPARLRRRKREHRDEERECAERRQEDQLELRAPVEDRARRPRLHARPPAPPSRARCRRRSTHEYNGATTSSPTSLVSLSICSSSLFPKRSTSARRSGSPFAPSATSCRRSRT